MLTNINNTISRPCQKGRVVVADTYSIAEEASHAHLVFAPIQASNTDVSSWQKDLLISIFLFILLSTI